MKIRCNSAITFWTLPWLVLGLTACASSGSMSRATVFPVEVAARRLEPAEVSGSIEVVFVGGYVLEADRAEFGGFSGMLLEDHQLVAVSDRGFWWQQPWTQDESGQLVLGGPGRMGPLFDFGGRIADSRDRRDAEEMAPWPGGILVSYEGEHRIALYRRERPSRRPASPAVVPLSAVPLSAVADSRPRRLKVPLELDATFENGGIEAMTRLADGRLVLFSEEQRDREGFGLLWVGEPTRGLWRRRRLELFEDFVPTSAATLPDGDVLLLERSYTESRGVRSRVRRLPAEAFAPLPSGPRPPIAGNEILRIEPPEAVDNFEGIEILPMTDGRVFFLLLADDNFSDSQRTLLLQFELLSP